MRDLPGRKSVILFSEGFSVARAQVNAQGRETFEITEALQDRSGKIKDTQSRLRFLA